MHNQYMAEEVIGIQRVTDAKALAALVADCTLALTTLGFSKGEAKAAVARLKIRRGESLEEVIRAALQETAQPRV